MSQLTGKRTAIILTASYMDNQKILDPFREQLLYSISIINSLTICVKVNDYCDESTGRWRSAAAHYKLLELINLHKPTSIISINGSGLSPELMNVVGTGSCVIWFVDNPWRFPNQLFKTISQYKNIRLFGPSQIGTKWLRNKFPEFEIVETLLFCTTPVTQAVPALKTRPIDITFIGTLWNLDQFGLLLCKLNATDSQKKMALNLLESHFSVYNWELPLHFRTIFPDVNLGDDAIFATFDDHCSSTSRLTILETASKFAKTGFVAGNEYWQHQIGLRNPGAFKFLKNEKIESHERLSELYGSTKIAINIVHHQSRDGGMPFRCFDILKSGSIMLTNSEVDPKSGFVEGKNYFRFNCAVDIGQMVSRTLGLIDQGKLEVADNIANLVDQHTFDRRACLLCGYSTIVVEERGIIFASKFKMNVTQSTFKAGEIKLTHHDLNPLFRQLPRIIYNRSRKFIRKFIVAF